MRFPRPKSERAPESDAQLPATKSGTVPIRTSLRPPSVHPGSPGALPKLWDDDELDETTGETGAAPGSARKKGQPRLTIMTGSGAGRVIAVDRVASVIGRSRSADIRLRDDGVSRQHCQLFRTGDAIEVHDMGSRNGTLVNGKRVTRAPLAPGDRLQVGAAVLQLGMFDDTEETLARKLFEASTRDPLTRAFNRHYFSERLEAELSHSRRHETPLSVMILDIDGLKDVNASYGVAAGDAVLRAVVETIESAIRTEDLFCRYGGDELAFLVREPLATAARTAERLRLKIEALRMLVAGRQVQVTASIGVAEVGEPGALLSGEGLVHVAEKRVHRAKLLGRNCVCKD